MILSSSRRFSDSPRSSGASNRFAASIAAFFFADLQHLPLPNYRVFWALCLSLRWNITSGGAFSFGARCAPEQAGSARGKTHCSDICARAMRRLRRFYAVERMRKVCYHQLYEAGKPQRQGRRARTGRSAFGTHDGRAEGAGAASRRETPCIRYLWWRTSC